MIKRTLVIIICLLAFLVGFCYWCGLKSARGEEKIFVINKGEPVISIATRLEREEIIKNRWVFLIYLKLIGKESNIQAGSFRLSGNDVLPVVVRKLQKGRLDFWLTVLEGWRREEIAQEVQTKANLDQNEFLEKTKNKEGYLFPDSYLVPMGVSIDRIIAILEENFQDKWQLIEENILKTGLTQEQVVILASLVEREVKLVEDKQIVAGILIKRWRADWLLQIDAAVQYAKASLNCKVRSGQTGKDSCNWWPKVTKVDLEINSSYNTYRNKGLPPAPICNPSISSLKAVVNYKPTSYWFYLSDKLGKTHFAENLEEHQSNIRRYLR